MWTPKGAALIYGPALIKGNMVQEQRVKYISNRDTKTTSYTSIVNLNTFHTLFY